MLIFGMVVFLRCRFIDVLEMYGKKKEGGCTCGKFASEIGEIRGDASVVRAPFPYEMKAERNGQIIVKKCPNCGTELSVLRRCILERIGYMTCGKCGHVIVKMNIVH